jgi:hypothetical protein
VGAGIVFMAGCTVAAIPRAMVRPEDVLFLGKLGLGIGLGAGLANALAIPYRAPRRTTGVLAAVRERARDRRADRAAHGRPIWP